MSAPTPTSSSSINLKKRSNNGRKLSSSLNVLFNALIGELVIIELRNETTCKGILNHADDIGNLHLSSVEYIPFLSNPMNLEMVYIPAKQVRYCRLPDHIDVLKTIHKYEQNLDNYQKKYQRSKRKAPKKTESAVPAVQS